MLDEIGVQQIEVGVPVMGGNERLSLKNCGPGAWP